MAILISSWPESYFIGGHGAFGSGSINGYGVTFTSIGHEYRIRSSKFYVVNNSGVTGTLYSKIYKQPSDSDPWVPLATSNPIEMSTVSSSYSLVEFTFPDNSIYKTKKNSNNVVTIEADGCSGAGFDIAWDGATVAGGCYYENTSEANWSSMTHIYRLIYYVYGDTSDTGPFPTFKQII